MFLLPVFLVSSPRKEMTQLQQGCGSLRVVQQASMDLLEVSFTGVWGAVLWRSEEVRLSAKGHRALCRVA